MFCAENISTEVRSFLNELNHFFQYNQIHTNSSIVSGIVNLDRSIPMSQQIAGLNSDLGVITCSTLNMSSIILRRHFNNQEPLLHTTSGVGALGCTLVKSCK